MNYQKPKFSVAMQGDAYGKGFDQIDWSEVDEGIKRLDEEVTRSIRMPRELFVCPLCGFRRSVTDLALCDNCIAAAGP